jgi:hypothetical protein
VSGYEWVHGICLFFSVYIFGGIRYSFDK